MHRRFPIASWAAFSGRRWPHHSHFLFDMTSATPTEEIHADFLQWLSELEHVMSVRCKDAAALTSCESIQHTCNFHLSSSIVHDIPLVHARASDIASDRFSALILNEETRDTLLQYVHVWKMILRHLELRGFVETPTESKEDRKCVLVTNCDDSGMPGQLSEVLFLLVEAARHKVKDTSKVLPFNRTLFFKDGCLRSTVHRNVLTLWRGRVCRVSVRSCTLL